MFSKTYKIKTATLLTVFFKYNGSFSEYYDRNKERPEVSSLSCINDDIKKDLDTLTDSLEYPSKDAKVLWDKKDGKFDYVEGSSGLMVDRNAIVENLYRAFDSKTRIELESIEIPPKKTVEMLKKHTAERATFSTGYASSSENRKHNIAVAAGRLNGLVIPARSEFHFNKAVGPRTVDNGFLMAKIISGGDFVNGVGGGVCQVSTTLFNAWIRAGLQVKNAVSHSLPVSYIGPSLDAMVSSRNDLVLYNNSDGDIYLKAWTVGDRVFFTVYGIFTGEKIEIRNEIVRIIPSPGYDEVDMPLQWKEGETFRIIAPASDGLVSNAYKDVYVNGKLVKTEKLRSNTYMARKGKIVRRKTDKSDNPLEYKDELKKNQSILLTINPSLVSSTV
ncbi:MAG: VanW family protein [Clostridia bacterium]|nr:VanW family protein [Clostridia bacterium]